MDALARDYVNYKLVEDEIPVLKRNLSCLFPIGALMLSGGLLLHNFLHARSTEFAAGFLIGMSIVFLIAASAKQFNRPNLR